MMDAREARNRVLMELLEGGMPVRFPAWSKHARQRLANLRLQGLDVADADRILAGEGTAYWSRKYGCPLRKYGDLSLAFTVTARDDVLVVTVLPATQDAWDRVHQSGYRVLGRERRPSMTGAVA